MSTPLEARNADISDLFDLLKQQDHDKLDVVTPLVNVRSRGGIIHVAGLSALEGSARFLPTAIADGHFADKLNIPLAFLRRMRDTRVDVYDELINRLIHGSVDGPDGHHFQPATGMDPRTVTLRLFLGDPGEVGVLRAVLTDRYGIIDDFDVALALMEGVKAAGTPYRLLGCDKTETRMVIRIAAPEIFSRSPRLLEGYRSPFKGKNLPQWARDKFGVDGDGVFVGLCGINSETGQGAWDLCPVIYTLSCLNGMMIRKDALRRVHVGKKIEEGVVRWSSDTQRKALDLVSAQTRDAVAAFLNPEYVAKMLADIEEKAGQPVARPEEAIRVIAKELSFTEAEREGILAHFIQGGQMTAGGIMQAVTSFAQELEDADAAFDLEANAYKALELAAGAKVAA